MMFYCVCVCVFFYKIHAEEISGNNGYVELSFCAKKLDDKVRGCSHLFIVLSINVCNRNVFFSQMSL